ncbi:hypothetical protein R5R35_009640 [Gryllus longicercus]|uniref:C-type lectin domain-containing protein n=1 Tax=Gryllus longicercus TaxID=2509291 RepID=A0AAN9Z2P4_9ORTH
MAASAGGAGSALVASLLLAVAQGRWPPAPAASLGVQPNAQANASCPWRVNFIDGGETVERCIDELSITFAGTPSMGLAPEAPPDVQMASPLPGYHPLHGGNWYKLHSRPASWHAAREQCEREGGGAHLLVVDSAEEAGVVRALLGLRLHDNATLVHAGFYVQLVSVRGEALQFSWHERWVRGDPNALACGQMDSDGFLLLAMCTEQRAFVCEIESSPPPPTASPSSPSSAPAPSPWNPKEGDVPRGYEAAPGWNNSYYRLDGFGLNSYGWFDHNSHGGSWTAAEEICETENGYLASVESEEELNAIIDMLQNKGKKDKSVLWNTIYFGVRTGKPVTVLGDLVQESGFSRWGKYSSHHTWDESLCFWVDYKLLLHSIGCSKYDFIGMNYLCEIVSSIVYE